MYYVLSVVSAYKPSVIDCGEGWDRKKSMKGNTFCCVLLFQTNFIFQSTLTMRELSNNFMDRFDKYKIMLYNFSAVYI